MQDLCNSRSLVILNGRTAGDMQGVATLHQDTLKEGQEVTITSCVDYFLTDMTILQMVKVFQVLKDKSVWNDGSSNHYPIMLTLQMTVHWLHVITSNV
jgi:hypothetical protein